MGSKRPETDSEVFWGKNDPQGPAPRRRGWLFGLGRGKSKSAGADGQKRLPDGGRANRRQTGYIDYADVTLAKDAPEPDEELEYILPETAEQTVDPDKVVLPERLMQVALGEKDATTKLEPADKDEAPDEGEVSAKDDALSEGDAEAEGDAPAEGGDKAEDDASTEDEAEPEDHEATGEKDSPVASEVPAEEPAEERYPNLVVRVEASPNAGEGEKDAAVVVAMRPKGSDAKSAKGKAAKQAKPETEHEPEPKPKAKPEPAAESKLEPKTEQEPEPKAEPEPAAATAPAPATKPAVKPALAQGQRGRHFSDAMAAPGRDYDDTDLAEDEIAQLKARAEAGDRTAMRSLGNRYQAGNGVPKNYDLMREWWERAAQAGNTTAMWDLGYYYLIGKYLDQDVARGVAWFDLAIENGNADAAFQLALCYGTGMFVEKSYDTARKYFTQALRLGREDAQDEIDECDRMLQEGAHADASAGPRGGNIVLSHVSRSFGRKKVLDDINLTIKGGELVAIVGSSGGGKSTLGSIILGTLRPTKGRVIFEGELGFVPQQNLVHQNLRVRQQLEFYARAVKHLPGPKAKERIDWVMRELELTGVSKTLIRKCSGGEKRRVSVACELLSYPDGLLLDEPTSGLDPGDSGNLVAVLHALVHDERMSCLVINHDYENIQLFDKICFLAHGKVCFYGTPDKLFEYFDTRSTREIYTLMDKDPVPFIRRFEEWRRDHPDALGGMC
ncbi:MAG: ATP-binding cassette domain-containing protein [Coriobacteriaceae bacterium]|nr:MAG: ATP-binding cassette domain-containing protein [Coriobacteriaceae bacterium]